MDIKKKTIRKATAHALGVLLCSFLSSGTARAADEMSYGEEATSSTWKGFPSTAVIASETKIIVERDTPNTVRPDVEYTYELQVANRSFSRVDNVVVTETVPMNFTLVKTFPPAQVRDNVMKWDLGMMAPGQKEIITVTGKAMRSGKVVHKGAADLSFDLGQMTSIMEVVEPLLVMKVDAPENVIINQDIPVVLSFRNNGSAPVIGAKLIHMFPKGMSTVTGDEKVELTIGNLPPNAVKTYKLDLMVEKTGQYTNRFVASAEDNVSAVTSVVTNVRKPILSVTAKAPSKRFVGNVISYDINLRNTGDAEARDVVIELPLPSDTTFQRANEAGVLEGNNVVWRASALQPGEEKTVQARIIGEKIMNARVKVTANAIAAAKVSSTMLTEVAGIPALLMKLSDINDPVAVGETETYVIQISNQGSLPATGVVVTCPLESGMAFVKAVGPTKAAKGEGENTITFAPLAKITPGSEAEWRVTVKAVKPGDVRFKVQLNSDQLTRSVEENEPTHFYE